MTVKRVVPNINSEKLDQSQEFYVDFLGFELAMDLGFIRTFVSPTIPAAQISLLIHEETSIPYPDLSLEVSDVDEVHSIAVQRGYEIVYPLTDEPWGVRRFFVVDPNGMVLNILSHK